MRSLALGIDVGTSGCRGVIAEPDGTVVAEAAVPLPPPIQGADQRIEQDPALWWSALQALLSQLGAQRPLADVGAVALDGTSGTILLAGANGNPLGPALMYNDGRARAQAERIAGLAPRESAAHGPFSSMAKLLWLTEHPVTDTPRYALHQADWLVGKLTGRWGHSDANNCLKLGYDPMAKTWPAWLDHLGVDRGLLPQVHEPGTPICPLADAIAAQFGLRRGTPVLAGTTDSTAAVLATGVSQIGEAVTSLGSTLVLKVISEQPIFDPGYGVYSQPLRQWWLAGGGSNSGGNVLRHFFSDAQMHALTSRLDPDRPTELDYYPLLRPGERFPVCDPQLPPRLSPRPADDAVFFQGLLEGMAQIEAEGYRRLAELGAPYPACIVSIGGGAQNAVWTRIRQRILRVPMRHAAHTQAAYGSARLAIEWLAANPSEN